MENLIAEVSNEVIEKMKRRLEEAKALENEPRAFVVDMIDDAAFYDLMR